MVGINVQQAIIVLLVVLIQHLAQLEPILSMKAVRVDIIVYLVKTTGIMICQVKKDVKSVVQHQPLWEAQPLVLVLV